MKKDTVAYTVIFTFVVCMFFVFFLSLANELTRERVASNRRFAERSAILKALGIAYDSPDKVDTLFASDVRTVKSGETELYGASVAGAPRFAKRFSGSALWGTVRGVMSVDAEVGRIAGLEIVSHNETPGLGGRIDESWFKDQFKGELIGPEGIRIRQGSGKGDSDHENGELDAVTGASLTSRAMENIINAEIAALRAVRDTGGLK